MIPLNEDNSSAPTDMLEKNAFPLNQMTVAMTIPHLNL